VAVRYGPGDLHIEVSDDGLGVVARGGAGQAAAPSAPTAAPSVPAVGPSFAGIPSTGHGLQGMRERAAAAGGTIQICPVASGGFRVAAWFPCPPDAFQAPVAGLEAPAIKGAGDGQ
jgi:hypothetical protein